MKVWGSLAALALCPSLAWAQAAPIGAGDPDSVVAAIVAYGHKARREVAEDGDPFVAARRGTLNYYVDFYGCEEGADCKDIQFSLKLDMAEPLATDFANTWNANWIMGRVFVDTDGNPTLTMTVVGTGGITEQNFRDTIEVWEFAMDTLITESGW